MSTRSLVLRGSPERAGGEVTGGPEKGWHYTIFGDKAAE